MSICHTSIGKLSPFNRYYLQRITIKKDAKIERERVIRIDISMIKEHVREQKPS